MKISEKDIKEAIKHFESVRDNATVVLESDFGAKPNESDLVYRNRKKYAELAIQALKKQISTVTYTENKQNRREHMKNRYLFKAKRIDNKEWVTGALICSKDEIYKIVTSYLDGCDNGGMILACAYDVDESTVCQCTGLKDKNDNLIWEHDAVERIDIHKSDEPTVGVIEYDIENTAFIIHWLDKPKYSAVLPWKEKIQVIGNEFDNLKLSESEVDMNKKEELNNYNKIRLKKRADPKRKARIVNRLLKADFFKER